MSFDLVIRGGTVYDGTGAEGRVADVGVKDGRIAAIGSLEPNGARDRRRRPGRRARLHRHPQPLRLHAAHGSARGQRDPPGRHDRGRRQLRLRLLPDPRPAAGAARDLRLLRRPPDHLELGRRVLRAARGRAARRQRAQPRPERTAAAGDARPRRPAGRRRRAGRDAGAAARVARPRRLGLLDRARVRAGAGGDRGRADGARAEGAVLRDPHAQARRGRRRRGGRGDPHRRERRGAAAGLAPRPAQRDRGEPPLHRARRDRARRGPGRRVRHAHAHLRADEPLRGPARLGARRRAGRARGDPARSGEARRDAPAPLDPERRQRLVARRAARQRDLAGAQPPRPRLDRRRPRPGAARRRLRPAARRASTSCTS